MDINTYQNFPLICRICLKHINYNSELTPTNSTALNNLTTIQQKATSILQDSICRDCYVAPEAIRGYGYFNNVHLRSIFNGALEENKSDLLTYKIVSDILKEDEVNNHNQEDAKQAELNQRQYLDSKSFLLLNVENKDRFTDYLPNGIKHELDDKQNIDLCCKLCKDEIPCNNNIESGIRSSFNDFKYDLISTSKCKLTTHTKQELQCDFCTYKTLLNSELMAHTKTHKLNKPYKCTECQFRCSSKSYLNIHRRIHTGENPYKCNICPYSTPFKYTLSVHMRTHVGVKPYRCTQCDFRCSTSGYLETHMRIHTGETPYNCNICGYNTTFKYTLSVHMRTHLGSKPYQCKECNFKCSSESYLKKHMKGHSEEVYTCSICTYSATCRSMVTHHMKTHTGEKPFKCKQCDFRAYRNSDVQKHMKMHLEKPVESIIHNMELFQSNSI